MATVCVKGLSVYLVNNVLVAFCSLEVKYWVPQVHGVVDGRARVLVIFVLRDRNLRAYITAHSVSLVGTTHLHNFTVYSQSDADVCPSVCYYSASCQNGCTYHQTLSARKQSCNKTESNLPTPV